MCEWFKIFRLKRYKCTVAIISGSNLGKGTFINYSLIGIFIVEPGNWLTTFTAERSHRMFQRCKDNKYIWFHTSFAPFFNLKLYLCFHIKI